LIDQNEVRAIEAIWASDRFKGITRPYSAERVLELRGSMKVEYTIARVTAEKLWGYLNEPGDGYVNALGALTGNQAVQMVEAGLRGIYLSGWQVAADANLGMTMYPDQSLYPANSVPAIVQRINNALIRRDQVQTLSGQRKVDYFQPIVADAEAGFGGPLNAYELMLGMIQAGAAGVHYEDQLASAKKCGHLGGKVLVPSSEFVTKLHAARLAADVAGTPTVLVARTDADAAGLLTSDIDDRDKPFCTGERTEEGFYVTKPGIDQAIARALNYAPYADLIWCETSTPDMAAAKKFADAVHAQFPGKLLAYNCSPSFNWKSKLVRRRHRQVPERNRRHGLQVPVHHPRRLPQPQPRHVGTGQRLPRTPDERLRGNAAARVQRRRARLRRRQAPALRRHRLLRRRHRDLWLHLHPGAQGLHGRGAVQALSPLY
jgi:isocitrate lyase